MKITLLQMGKTDKKWLKAGIEEYTRRMPHYIPLEIITVNDLKNTKKLSIHEQKQKEGELLLNHFAGFDYIVLFDENGKAYSSVELAQFLEKKMIQACRWLLFVIGGAYGFSDEVYARANAKIALSRLTFSHQMVRLIAVEQLYRAFTIIKGEPYHHQ